MTHEANYIQVALLGLEKQTGVLASKEYLGPQYFGTLVEFCLQ